MGKGLLDFGHGGIDSGAIGGGRKEKDDVLLVGMELKKILEYNGETIHTTRSTDATVSLQARVDMEKAGKYNYFVSLHRNSGGGTGVETFCYKFSCANARKLATYIQENLVAMGLDNANGRRGVKEGDFKVLRETKTDAVLVEMGFIDNGMDNQLFASRYKDYAVAIAKAILKFQGKTYKEIPVPVEQPTPQVTEGLMWRVVVGTYADKTNAEKRLAEAKAKGLDGFLVPYQK